MIKDSIRKYILLGFVVIVVGGIIAAKIAGANQDEEFKMDDALYQQVTTLFNEEKYEEAYSYSTELLKRQPDEEVVNYLGALLASQMGEYEQGAILMQKALDLNPYKADDAMFMLQLAEVLVLAERNDDARIVLNRCLEMGWVPEEYPTYQERVAELLQTIGAE